ncbi:L-ribulose-5-phosphate 3-epimerase [Telmatospirillum sp.]|uniref:L-ribulose-5-phosphate 3-epimerase n=1 Tax=Telmatospirillum sp. TaxID=2079197 RepID=UPI00285129C8|nr:L-ribulose-5-phosphate 3-epimerase [Telmatospirillum sp.]MDR3440024.1 L-ribulose-5-phosphate 3-epimerase [Telmatospirillum sp.]
MSGCALPPIGIYEKALPRQFDWSQRLAAARSIGFDFVEMSIDETDGRLATLDWSRAERRTFRRAVEESGINVPSICLSAHRRFPFGSADQMVRERARDIMRKAIGLATDTGIRTLQLAGYDVYYEPSTAESLSRFEEGLAWATELAGKAQVMLAVEIMDTPLMGSISKWLRYARQISSPWFQVYPDLGNLAAWGNDVPAELAKGIDHIVAVHVKDTLAVRPDFPGKFKEVPFGTGCVDFVAAFAALKRLGYHGCFLIEMWTGEIADPLAEVTRARTWVIDRMIEGGLA